MNDGSRCAATLGAAVGQKKTVHVADLFSVARQYHKPLISHSLRQLIRQWLKP